MKVASTPDVTGESVTRHLSTHVQGTESAFDDATFQATVDVDRVRKVYKLASVAPKTTPGKPSSAVNGTTNCGKVNTTKILEAQILGLMALRGAT